MFRFLFAFVLLFSSGCLYVAGDQVVFKYSGKEGVSKAPSSAPSDSVSTEVEGDFLQGVIDALITSDSKEYPLEGSPPSCIKKSTSGPCNCD